MVWNAPVRAPMAPSRAPVRPRTVRQTRAKRSRSARNSGPDVSQVCVAVSVKGTPYCQKLLVTLILPQNASRRSLTDTLSFSSFDACNRIGTFSRARLTSSAIAISSPKFGRQITSPSIRSRCALKCAA